MYTKHARYLKRSRIRSKVAYETKFARRLQKESYEPGALVLIRNNPIENTVSIERKTANRYMGPYEVIRRTQGGSYVLKEMNGNMLRHTTAAFRLIPYVQRKELNTLVQGHNAEEDLDPELSSSSQHSHHSQESFDAPISSHESDDSDQEP